MSELYAVHCSGSYLQHHGIKGMKWGVRRFQNKDGSLTSAGEKRYYGTTRRQRKIERYEQRYRSKGLDEETARAKAEAKYKRRRNALIVGGTVLAAYATYKFIDSGKAHQMAVEGRSIADRLLGTDTEVFKKNDALKSASDADEIMAKVVSRINPEYGSLGTTNNCRRCTFAYEMSRRGYDVRATRSVGGTGQNAFGFSNAVNRHGLLKSLASAARDGRSDDANSLLKEAGIPTYKTSNPFELFASFPDGSRGEIGAKWTVGGGHSMAWEIIGGKPVIFDCQTGKKYSSADDFGNIAKYAESFSVNRLDNIDLDMRFLERWLTNA